jgi:hypothetical protein
MRRKADRKTGATFIDAVLETKPCHYVFYVCAQSSCVEENMDPPMVDLKDRVSAVGEPQVEEPREDSERPQSQEVQMDSLEKEAEGEIKKEPSSGGQPITEISPKEQLRLREQVREMFYHGYDSYLKYAFPQVCSASCLLATPLVSSLHLLSLISSRSPAPDKGSSSSRSRW